MEQALYRKQRRERSKQIEEEKRVLLQNKLAQKAANAAAIRAQRDNDRSKFKTQRKLQAAKRMKKAERVREAKLYEKQKVIAKMQANYKRMEAMNDMKKAIEKKRKAIIREENIRR